MAEDNRPRQGDLPLHQRNAYRPNYMTIDPQFLPLPEPQRLPTHSSPHRLADKQVAVTPKPHKAHMFNCSCGANPLNNPHNLAVYADAYTPLAGRSLPLDLLRAANPRHPFPESFPTLTILGTHPTLSLDEVFRDALRLRQVRTPGTYPEVEPTIRAMDLQYLHTRLWRLVPSELQSMLRDPVMIDLMQNVEITDPDSPLVGWVNHYWPEHYSPPKAPNVDRPHNSDRYDRDEYFEWMRIHRLDHVMMNPVPYLRASKQYPNMQLGKYASSYLPAMPVFHRPNPEAGDAVLKSYRPSPEQDGLCGCGAKHEHKTFVQHRYEAFIGRTFSRALEVHTEPWQEGSIGASTLDAYGYKYYATYRQQAVELHHLITDMEY